MWQMAEVLRKTGFSPVIYSRESHEETFEQLLYIYIESGFPLLLGVPNHVVVAIGHKETTLNKVKIGDSHGYMFTFTKGLIVNDDNRIPYADEYDLAKIDSFIVPLPEIDIGTIFNNNDNYQEFQVENMAYQIYTNNLEEV